jgi:hypothetical protein
LNKNSSMEILVCGRDKKIRHFSFLGTHGPICRFGTSLSV